MKNKHYLGEVMERFMTDKEQEKFDQNYNDVKMVTLGRSKLVRNKYSVPHFGNINLELENLQAEIDKIIEKQVSWEDNILCACGGDKLPNSDFCRDCI